MGHVVYLVGKPDFLQDFFYPPADILFVLPIGRLQDELQVLADGAVVKQLEVLEDDTHFTSQGRYLLAFQFLYSSTEDFGLFRFAFGQIKLAIERFQKTAFAGTDLPNDVYEFTFRTLEVYIFQHKIVCLVNVYLLIIN